MDLNFIISLVTSGVVAAIVTGLINRRTQIKAIKESGIYLKRGEVLDQLMKRMEKLDSQIAGIHFSLLKDSKVEIEIDKGVNDACTGFSEYFKENRHYLPKELATKINLLIYEYQKINLNFEVDKNINNVTLTFDQLNEKLKDIINVSVKRKEDIADEFRKMIGVQ